MRRLIPLLLITTCFAQVQAKLPQLQDSSGAQLRGIGTGVMPMTEAVNTGDVIDVCVFTYDGANTAYPVDDSLGNGSYTLTTPTTVPRYTGTSVGNRGLVYHAYTTSAFSGNNTVTLHMPGISGSNYDMIISRYSGLSGVVDGSVATATYGGTGSPGGVGTITANQTTTTNNDILSSCTVNGGINAASLSGNTAEYNAFDFGVNGIMDQAATQHAGAAGTQSVTVNTWNDFAFGGTTSFAMQTLAFKPNGIFIADTVLPDVGNNVAYSAQLHCIGGTAAQTYSLFSGSLPTGLNLNTSTGVISGTTTVNGTSTLGFRCTDGTVTSSTASLTLTVNNAVNVPSIRSATATPRDSFWPTLNVQCNDRIVVIARGYDAHYTEGGTQIINGVNNDFIKDDFNSTWHRVDTYRPGSPQSPLAVYVSSPMQFSGANNVTIGSNIGSAANPISQALVISGGEMVDATVGTQVQPGATSGTFSQSYTTVVPNTLLVNLSLADGASVVTPTLSMNSPFTNTISSGGDSQGVSLYSYALIASPSSVTATTNFSGARDGSGGNNATMFAQLLVPIRPAPATACSSTVFAGEKLRRQVW